jgi:hypothetical protein
LRNRKKASCTSAGVQGFAEAFVDAFAEALVAGACRNLAAAIFAGCFGRGFAALPEDFLVGFLAIFCAIVFDLKDGLRVIFDMIRIY